MGARREALDWASGGIGASGRHADNVLAVVRADLACTVDLERMERTTGGRTITA